jgi:hypothetical protein
MSNINPYNIDGTYPVAGQDNDSQGFRDNFTNIRNNFGYAASELGDLQSKAITTSALTGSTLTNDMSYAALKRPQLFSPSYTYVDKGAVSGAVTVYYDQGAVQRIETGASITSVTISNWPTTGQFGLLKLWVNVTNTAYTMTVSPSLLGLDQIFGANTTSGLITFGNIGTYIFEFGTGTAGSTTYIADLSHNHTYNSPTIVGNLTLTGGGVVDQAYQYLSSPSTNFWSNLSATASRLIIDATSTITAGNVTLPNVSVDGTIYSIHSTAQITTFGANTRQANTIMRSNATFTLGAGTGVDYFYKANENTWYKIR